MAPVTVEALRGALGAATADDGGAAPRLVRALEAIGWRGGDAMDADELAPDLVPALVACAREHGSIAVLYRQLAGLLRAAGPLLDGGLPPVDDYVPAAAELVRRFIDER